MFTVDNAVAILKELWEGPTTGTYAQIALWVGVVVAACNGLWIASKALKRPWWMAKGVALGGWWAAKKGYRLARWATRTHRPKPEMNELDMAVLEALTPTRVRHVGESVVTTDSFTVHICRNPESGSPRWAEVSDLANRLMNGYLSDIGRREVLRACDGFIAAKKETDRKLEAARKQNDLRARAAAIRAGCRDISVGDQSGSWVYGPFGYPKMSKAEVDALRQEFEDRHSGPHCTVSVDTMMSNQESFESLNHGASNKRNLDGGLKRNCRNGHPSTNSV